MLPSGKRYKAREMNHSGTVRCCKMNCSFQIPLGKTKAKIPGVPGGTLFKSGLGHYKVEEPGYPRGSRLCLTVRLEAVFDVIFNLVGGYRAAVNVQLAAFCLI